MSAKKKTQQRGEDFKPEDVLQAVVIADSFNVRFAPITQNKPRTLLPLANVPLLNYTLESLCNAGIEQVFVFCCAHSDQIKEHIRKSSWASETSPMEVTTVLSESCMSVGDALRDIDARSLITSDFLLINGDMVSNVKLRPIIEQHRIRRIKEKTPIMTMILKKAPPGHHTRCKEDDVLLIVKASQQRVLSYQKVVNSKKFNLPVELFDEHHDLDLRYDLLDCHMSVCSPTVPQLFTDNFDYLTREDFVKGILVNEEIFGNTIHLHVLEDEYAARVSNLTMYDAVSQDVLSRWTYPVVPDMWSYPAHNHRHGRHNVYLHKKDITLARGCVLEENVLIGQGTKIGSNTSVNRSVIGRNCHIGDNVTIEGAYIWDNVRVGDNCHIKTSVMDDNVVIKTNCTIPAGCVLSHNVVIGPDISLPEASLIMATPPVDEFGDAEPAVLDVAIVGTEGRGYVYTAPSGSDDESDEPTLDTWGLKVDSDESSTSSEGSDTEEDIRPPSPPMDDGKLFYDEVIGTLARALTMKINTENMILEVNSLKHAYGIQIMEVNVMVSKAILELPLQSKDGTNTDPKDYIGQLKKNFKQFLPLLKNYIRSVESQKDLMASIEEFSSSNDTVLASAMKIVHFLYDNDVLIEDTILLWHANLDTSDAKLKQLHSNMAPLVKWLEEAESDSEEDDD